MTMNRYMTELHKLNKERAKIYENARKISTYDEEGFFTGWVAQFTPEERERYNEINLILRKMNKKLGIPNL